MKKTLLAVVVLIAVIGTIWWITRAPEPVPAPVSAPPVQTVTPTTPPETPAVVPPRVPALPPEPAVKPEGAAATVAYAGQYIAQLYGYAGSLNYEEAKTLVEQRELRRKGLVDQLVALGPGGARAMADRYDSALSMREKMMYIEALGKIQDPEAVAVLQELLAKEGNSYSMQKEVVIALGQRPELEAQAALSAVLSGAENKDLRFAAAQALSGDEAALPDLAARVRTDASVEVQKEAIGSIGKIGTEAAQRELAGIAQSGLPAELRKTAIQELARTFQERALPDLRTLAKDPDPDIRMNVVRALSRIHTSDASALLAEISGTDISPEVRTKASDALAAAAPAASDSSGQP